MIEDSLRTIEPSDGVMYDGVVSFFHRDVSLDEKLGKLPRMIVVGVDRGGKCDTIQFNAQHREIAPQIKKQYMVLLSEMKRAIKTADERLIGKIATRSSELSQFSNPHPYYHLMRELQETTGAIGLVAAHSGTYLGLLYSQSDLHHPAKIADTQRLLNGHGIFPEIFTTV
ncbi:hypothetical protein FG152_17215 [Ochrobactrum sp. XJ1]|nr:hypothetical protein [Ochrobactrum sp. XJ1]